MRSPVQYNWIPVTGLILVLSLSVMVVYHEFTARGVLPKLRTTSSLSEIREDNAIDYDDEVMENSNDVDEYEESATDATDEYEDENNQDEGNEENQEEAVDDVKLDDNVNNEEEIQDDETESVKIENKNQVNSIDRQNDQDEMKRFPESQVDEYREN